MSLESITGMITSAENQQLQQLLGTMGLSEAGLIMLGIIFMWVLFLLFINLVLFVISCFTHDLPFRDTVETAYTSFTTIYRGLIKYYIPALILAAIVSLYNISDFFLKLFQLHPARIVLFLLALPFLIAFGVYYFVLDTSLAKSYYQSIKTRKFVFSWISFEQALKLVAISIIFMGLLLLSLVFLGIPWIILSYATFFVRYPVIVENRGITDSIKKGFSILKQEFWNVVFFVSMYSLLLLVVRFALDFNPLTVMFANIIIAILIQPFATLWFTNIYYRIENKYQKGAQPKSAQARK